MNKGDCDLQMQNVGSLFLDLSAVFLKKIWIKDFHDLMKGIEI